MRTTSRTITAALLAAPLVVGTLAPAQAAQQGHIKSSGTFIGMQIEGPESSDTIPGNYLSGGLDVFEDYASGYAMAFDCVDGATPWEGEGCEVVAEIQLDGPVSTWTAKGKNGSTTVSGDVNVSSIVFDEETGEGYAEWLGTMPLDAVVTPFGKAVRTTESFSVRDPNTGESYSFRATTTTQQATVSGMLGAIEVGPGAYVGTFRAMDKFRTP